MAWRVSLPEDDFGGSTLIIVETTGPQRSVQLDGRAGPLKGVAFGGSMRAEITHYPGNPIASVQVLGAEEDPTTFKGKWKRRFFAPIGGTDAPDASAEAQFTVLDSGGSRSIVDVPDMVAFMDSIRRAGQLLEVSWAELVRVGILKKFTPTFHSRMEVEWEMEFEWISQGEVYVETQKKSDSLSDIEQAAAAAIANVVDVVDTQIAPERFEGTAVTEATGAEGAVLVEPSASASLTDGPAPVGASVGQAVGNVALDPTIAEQVNALVGGYAELRDLVSSYVEGAVNTGNATRSAVASLLGIGQDAQYLYDYTQSVAAEAWFRVADATLIGVSDLLAMTTVTRRLGAGAREVRNLAYRKKDDLARTLEPNLYAIFTAQEGQNLRDVSLEYYGTADGWRFLKRYNGLDSSELEAGQVVFVPKRMEADEEEV